MFYRKIFLFIYLFLYFAYDAPAQESKKNIASLNLCTDQILLSLAPLSKEEIVTNLAQDCDESALCDKVHSVSILPRDKELLWRHPPSLILEGEWASPLSSHMAEILHIPIYHMKNIENLEDIPKEMIIIGDLIGRRQEAEQIKEAFNMRLYKLEAEHAKKRLSAAIIGVDDGILLRNIVKRAGFNLLSLPSQGREEFLLRQDPDLLIVTTLGDHVSLKENYLFSPILQKYFNGVHHLMIKARLTLCGTVGTLDLLESLKERYNILSKG